ncbi:hypothetical protein [Kibdelosporangium aridum]|uniref:hypothetical protein n=1 Tax=Kibdelosporangium aridum TaxID=2030 RepID=UPI0005272118
MSGDQAIRARLKADWQRWALVAATLLMAAFAWREPTVAVFAAGPVLIWCSKSRSVKAGVFLLAIAAWVLLPRVLGLSGRWVPSVYEVCLFLPILTGLVFVVATKQGRWLRGLGLTAFAVMGILTAGYTAVMHSEGDTGNEGVRPGPSGLQIVEGEKECGSGGCTKALQATGDRAAERMRAHLLAQGFQPRNTGLCRIQGLLIPYKVCAGIKEMSPTTVRVSWSI